MTRHYPVLLFTLWLCILCRPILAAAQNSTSNLAPGNIGNELNLNPTIDVGHLGANLVVSVVGEKHAHLDRQAVVKLDDEARKRTLYQATSDNSQAIFGDLTLGKYAVEVSAVGYLTARKEVTVFDLLRSTSVEVVLQRDPMAVDLDAPNAPLSGKASKETRHAISDLNSNKLKDAQKHLGVAYKLAPSSAHINFLLGYLSYQQRNFEQAQSYLEKATTQDPRHVQALNLLGRVYLREGKNREAQAVLQRAVTSDPENWIAHNLLGDAYLRQHDFNNALAQAELALEGGKPGSVAAQIVRGEALADLGRDQEAIQALKTYLQSAPGSPTVPQVQDLIAQIEFRGAMSPAFRQNDGGKASAKTDLSLDSMQAILALKAWAPPDVDDVKPPVAAGVSCPYQQIIDSSGQRVKQLVDNVAQFSAIEDLLHERLDQAGNPISKETRKFDYVASISETQPGVLSVDEFRSGHYEVDALPDQIRTNGFPALALVFHPDMRDNFDIRCEGLGQLRGQATWLLRFAQREDRPNRLQAYKIGDNVYSVALKGRAWVSADKFQIVRMETQLVHPMDAAQLLAEHQITEYGPVAFPKKNVQLWLPKTAEVYLALRGRLYYRRHSFDHFMLFSVDSTDKVREAKGVHGPGSVSPRRRKHWWA
jgi:tetratricopeptide (TPR) repeat protein